jgi:hypothetical protein
MSPAMPPPSEDFGRREHEAGRLNQNRRFPVQFAGVRSNPFQSANLELAESEEQADDRRLPVRTTAPRIPA